MPTTVEAHRVRQATSLGAVGCVGESRRRPWASVVEKAALEELGEDREAWDLAGVEEDQRDARRAPTATLERQGGRQTVEAVQRDNCRVAWVDLTSTFACAGPLGVGLRASAPPGTADARSPPPLLPQALLLE
ncbi:hypothetical protein CYMTET_10790 [Cymbomonas tetramitiformis]|uniref:Uncharacterized protein n=1 Tax=Cymbomonas tetramitiformis TaxID=36881 RepID=A0AAE0LDH2_9CHLO|nr:hypothetical protein CYMTET_10790 [Cymbomonas tetramitiformis]